MSINEDEAKKIIPLTATGSFEIVDLPEENRFGVLKIANPKGWKAAFCKLSKFDDHVVNIKFSADVKRAGATGDLRWHVNSRDYPTVGSQILNAETDTWHTMAGEWTGKLIKNRVFYLSTYNNNSKATTYYIDKFNIDVELNIELDSQEAKVKKDLSHYRKTLNDMAKYLKDLIPANIPENYHFKTALKSIADVEDILSGVRAYRDFLYLLCDYLIADGSLYDKPPKSGDSHVSVLVSYPLLNNVKNVLFNIGYYGSPADNGSSLFLDDWKSLTYTISADGGQAALKLSAPKVAEALRFLTNCGIYFDGIDLDTAKPDITKITSLTVTYPDNPIMLKGLKVMAVAQRDFKIKGNDEAFLRCDYRVLYDTETDAASLLKDYIRPLPAEVQDFALKLHKRYLNAGLTCKPKVFFLNIQFIYSYKNKEVWSFFTSLISGSRILIKAQNTLKYADVIEKFPLPLQEKIARGYGCEKKRFDEPCQKGCHGFSFPLNDSTIEISKEIETWLDNELGAVRK